MNTKIHLDTNHIMTYNRDGHNVLYGGPHALLKCVSKARYITCMTFDLLKVVESGLK